MTDDAVARCKIRSRHERVLLRGNKEMRERWRMTSSLAAKFAPYYCAPEEADRAQRASRFDQWCQKRNIRVYLKFFNNFTQSWTADTYIGGICCGVFWIQTYVYVKIQVIIFIESNDTSDNECFTRLQPPVRGGGGGEWRHIRLYPRGKF
jgi:hypothetical protein